MQTQLVEWIEQVAHRGAIALIIDDIQRCDEASAAVLAALARSAPANGLMLVAGLRSDEAPIAPAAIEALRRASRTLELGGLDIDHTEELSRALFGPVPGLGPFARWIHQHTGGSPLQAIELARHLVDAGAIRFADAQAPSRSITTMLAARPSWVRFMHWVE